MVKLFPVPTGEPPMAAVYQLMTPDEGTAERVKLPVPQIVAGVVAVTVGIGVNVTVTACRKLSHPFKV